MKDKVFKNIFNKNLVCYFDFFEVKINHPFHLVSISPWPLCQSLGAILFLLGRLKFLIDKEKELLFLGLLGFIIVIFQ